MIAERNVVRRHRHLGFALCVLIGLFVHAPAPAGIDNSHHDIRRYLPDKDACLTCHGRKDTNYYGVMSEELGRVGGQCIFLCHSGKGILPETDTLVPKPGPDVDVGDYSVSSAPDFSSVFFTRSHGRKPYRLKDAAGRPVPWPPPGVTWQGVGDNVYLECTSCHAVHDNRYAPFLLAPLGVSGSGYNGLCVGCHADRATGNLDAPPGGNHPVEFVVDNDVSASRRGIGRNPRRIVIQKYGRDDGSGDANVFDVPNPKPADLNDTDASWAMGGHLFSGEDAAMEMWKAKGGRQRMGCYTCHSAHRPSSDDERNLLVLPLRDERGRWNPICVGCHGGAVTLSGDRAEWNVGMTQFGHPAGAESSRDPGGSYTTTVSGFKFRVTEPKVPAGASSGRFGPGGELLCTTCHKIHFGQKGTMALADLGQGTKAICKACHTGVGHPLQANPPDLPNSHHVTLTAEMMAVRIQWGFTNPQWGSTVTGRGDFSTGLDCADCHMYPTAHNW